MVEDINSTLTSKRSQEEKQRRIKALIETVKALQIIGEFERATVFKQQLAKLFHDATATPPR